MCARRRSGSASEPCGVCLSGCRRGFARRLACFCISGLARPESCVAGHQIQTAGLGPPDSAPPSGQDLRRLESRRQAESQTPPRACRAARIVPDCAEIARNFPWPQHLRSDRLHAVHLNSVKIPQICPQLFGLPCLRNERHTTRKNLNKGIRSARARKAECRQLLVGRRDIFPHPLRLARPAGLPMEN
jgi:hypothetical protein